MIGVILWPIRVLFSSFALWIFLSTVVPQSAFKFGNEDAHNASISKGQFPYVLLLESSAIRHSSVVAIIAHPDDEVMFFGPSLIELAKEKNDNDVSIVCLSPGNADSDGMGIIRTKELQSLARILGVKDVEMVAGFKDGQEENWDLDKIVACVDGIVKTRRKSGGSKRPIVLITFDENGVSGHANHISIHQGIKKWWNQNHKSNGIRKSGDVQVLCLKLLLFLEKYSFTLLTNVELFVDHISSFFLKYSKVNLNILFFKGAETVRFYSDLNMLALEYAAMAYGHFSQMVWFRYGWLTFSRYLTFNELVPLK